MRKLRNRMKALYNEISCRFHRIIQEDGVLDYRLGYMNFLTPHTVMTVI